MKNNKLIVYKENYVTKIIRFFKKIFFRKKEDSLKNIDEESSYDKQQKDFFINNIVIKENKEEKRLKILKLQYDNGEIGEEDILEEDMDKIIEMYEKETEKLNADTKIRKEHIAKMLKTLKSA